MVFESDFTWIVIAPGGAANMPLAREAVRAGAWGFVDLEDARDAEEFQQVLSELRSNADVPLGVKLDASRRSIWEPQLAAHPLPLNRVILTRPSRSASELRALVSGLQRLELEVLVEAVSVDEAVAAQQAGADGIVAKGSEAGGRIGDETSFLLLTAPFRAACRSRSTHKAAWVCIPRPPARSQAPAAPCSTGS